MSSRYKNDKETAAANGPVERYYRGVRKYRGRYEASVTNPGKSTSTWLGIFDTAEEAALAYDSGARQLHGDRAITNFPNPSNMLSPAATLAPEAVELRDPVERHYHGVYKRPGGRYWASVRNPSKKTNIYLGTFDTAEEAALAYDSATRQLQGNRAKTNFDYPNNWLSPAAALPPEALELSLSSYSSSEHAATGNMCMYHPLAPLPTEALEVRLSGRYSSGGHAATGPMFMCHPGVINNDIQNNVNMSYETSVGGGSSNSGYSVCSSMKLDLNFPPQ